MLFLILLKETKHFEKCDGKGLRRIKGFNENKFGHCFSERIHYYQILWSFAVYNSRKKTFSFSKEIKIQIGFLGSPKEFVFFFFFYETILVNANRVLATSRENQYLELCVFRHVSPAMPAAPMGDVPVRAAGEACMGLQGYSGPWLATSTPVTRARTITHIAARCTPRIRDESRRALPGSFRMKIRGNNSRDVMSSFVPAQCVLQKYNRASAARNAKI